MIEHSHNFMQLMLSRRSVRDFSTKEVPDKVIENILKTAIQNAGLVCLTHTPSPIGFLKQILKRPKNEKAYLLIPIGFPAKDAQVPVLDKKPYSESVKVF